MIGQILNSLKTFIVENCISFQEPWKKRFCHGNVPISATLCYKKGIWSNISNTTSTAATTSYNISNLAEVMSSKNFDISELLKMAYQIQGKIQRQHCEASVPNCTHNFKFFVGIRGTRNLKKGKWSLKNFKNGERFFKWTWNSFIAPLFGRMYQTVRGNELYTSKESDFYADFKYISFIKFSLCHQKLRAWNFFLYFRK